MLRLGATPVWSRSSGTWATPARIAERGSPLASRRPPTSTVPEDEPPQPGERLGELALAVAGDPGDPEHLARADGQGDVAQGVDATVAARDEPACLEHDLAELGLVASAPELDLAADHQRGELAPRDVRRANRADRATVAQHGDPVGDRHHLVQLVRDEDHRPLLGRHPRAGSRRAPRPPAA